MRRALGLAALALLAAAAPAAAEPPVELTIRYAPASARNYGPPRSTASIRRVVVHSIEGSYWGAISWFRNPRSGVAAHYVVSREGAVAQTVGDRRVAWHSGNSWMNRHSLGIEHEGYAWTAATFTDRQYRASAQLTARLLRRYVLPVDRRHVIGHNEVPDPRRPWLRGGYSHHTDPGPYWDWRRYMSYVASYAAGRVPPPPALDVTIPAISLGQRLRSVVRWHAQPAGQAVAKVEFRVDGVLRDRQHAAPYAFGAGAWNTTNEPNGRHTLSVRAITAAGRAVAATVPVTVANPATPLAVTSAGFVEGQPLAGPVRWEAKVNGRPTRVEFLVDDVVRDTRTRAPYVFGGVGGTWDTAKETPGPHALTVRAVGRKTAAEAAVGVTVAGP